METSKGRVLLIEDQPTAAALVDGLRAAGYDVTWLTTLREARQLWNDLTPEVLLLDTTLETDGLEFFQALRLTPAAPAGGVVVMTAPDDVDGREQALQLGAAAVLTKPVALDEVVSTIADLFAWL